MYIECEPLCGDMTKAKSLLLSIRAEEDLAYRLHIYHRALDV